MEFCGGGSLQEIYHGEGQDSRPQRATAFFPPSTPTCGRREELGPKATHHWLCDLERNTSLLWALYSRLPAA